jgi:hypothetical protein
VAYAAPEEPAAESEPKKADKVTLPTHTECVEWYDAWEEKTRNDRVLSARDYDYYDNDQWLQEEIEELHRRGQPVLTKNRIARKVNFILGDEAEKGVDPVARPKTPQHEDDARAATDALRATEEAQDFDGARSATFKDAMIAGYGGVLVEGDSDPDAETCAPLTPVPWNRLWWDVYSSRPDFGDARHKGVGLWKDLSEAVEDYPDAQDMLEQAVNDSADLSDTTDDKPRMWADRKRKRVKICEVYFRIGRDWYRGCFTKGGWLKEPELTGYMDDRGRRNVCPLIMMSCYVRNKDNGRYGIVRALISPQDEVNKRDSKALHLLSVNGVIAERDAIIDPQKFQTELAKADGYAEVEPGTLASPDGARIQLRNGAELAGPHIQLAQQARADIDGIGPSSSTMPDLPQSASGRAFIARQKAAAKELAPIFSHLYRFDLEVMQHDWMRIVQFRTEEWWLRVTDDQELTGHRFTALNQRMTRAQRLQDLMKKGAPLPQALEGAAGEFAAPIMRDVQAQVQAQMQQAQQMARPPMPGAPPGPPQGPSPPDPQKLTQAALMQHPLMQEEVTLNQAAKMGVDIMIGTTPESAMVEEEEFDSISKLLPTVVQARPDLAPLLVKTLIKASQLRAKREILQELDKGPGPEQQKAQQAQQQLQMAGAKAAVTVSETQAELNKAKAAQAQADAQTTMPLAQADIEAKKAQAMNSAASAGAKTGGPQPGGMPPRGMM